MSPARSSSAFESNSSRPPMRLPEAASFFSSVFCALTASAAAARCSRAASASGLRQAFSPAAGRLHVGLREFLFQTRAVGGSSVTSVVLMVVPS